MTSRRSFIAARRSSRRRGAARSATAQAPKEGAKQADFLFVQTAKGMTFDKATNKLTLTGVSPVTVFFSDRPSASPGTWRPASSSRSGARQGQLPLRPAERRPLDPRGDKLQQVVVVLQSPVLKGTRSPTRSRCWRAACRRKARRCRCSSMSSACR